jgi:hypothetical protein
MGEGPCVDAAALRHRLPDPWQVEGGRAGAYGFADASGPPAEGEVAACFSIQRDSGLWVASYKDGHELGAHPGATSERVSGTRERCVEWVIERVVAAEGSGDD